ncbi:MAG: hypothetical protein Q4B16_03655 [Bacteroidia bacterium]|nr:hypothetical protein [Bacteroidia bacterium]
MTKRVFSSLAAVLLCVFALAQENDPQKREKEFFENLDKQIGQLTSQLDLEDWQVFYVDSILTHDYQAMQKELMALQQKKVSNTDIYNEVAFRWQDRIDESLQKVFNEEQWAKYQKNGAARAKKARDKRRAKMK